MLVNRPLLVLAFSLSSVGLSACTATARQGSDRRASEPVPVSDYAASRTPREQRSDRNAARIPIPDLPQLPAQSAGVAHANTGLAGLSALPPLGSQAGAAAPTRSAPHFAKGARGRAQAALYDLEHRANLSPAQAGQVQGARAALKAGKTRQGEQLATGLDTRIRTAVQHYTVGKGDTLNTIAETVYGNAYLWPLIWDANRKAVPSPQLLRVGSRLTIHLYPTLDQAASALAYAHGHAASTP